MVDCEGIFKEWGFKRFLVEVAKSQIYDIGDLNKGGDVCKMKFKGFLTFVMNFLIARLVFFKDQG